MDKRLTPEMLGEYSGLFWADERNVAALNAVTAADIHQVALNRNLAATTDHTFSIHLKTPKATSQKKSGRCWLFAGLNVLRLAARQSLNLEQFELSQNYLMFWDKLEKANYFLENILETLDRGPDDRLVMHLLKDPIQDGGQWDMFANLAAKYGVVPKTVMPETASSGNTRTMNALVTDKLREFAAVLRRRAAEGADENELRRIKLEMLSAIYRLLTIHLGEPPRSFDWQWRDKDDEFHRDSELTPRGFFDRHVGVDLRETVCLINCPTADKPFDQLYTIDYLGNVLEGELIRYLNVELEPFKRAAARMLQDGKPVWFGCDVGKRLERKLGILAGELYRYDLVYGLDFESDKAERVDYGQSLMTHAMVLTGVDLDDDGYPRKWRVENSWGEKVGDEGYLVMLDDWFDEFVFEVAVERKYLSEEQRALLEGEPVHLPPWDPMGALAAAK